jgi:hypothetical protein
MDFNSRSGPMKWGLPPPILPFMSPIPVELPAARTLAFGNLAGIRQGLGNRSIVVSPKPWLFRTNVGPGSCIEDRNHRTPHPNRVLLAAQGQWRGLLAAYTWARRTASMGKLKPPSVAVPVKYTIQEGVMINSVTKKRVAKSDPQLMKLIAAQGWRQ